MSEAELTTFYLAVAILTIAAVISGELARRMLLPRVIGEILTGVILGPTVIRHFMPTVQTAIFPTTGNNHLALAAIATLGVSLFILAAGMEVDLKLAQQERRLAWPISIAGMVFPFIVAFTPAYLFPEVMGFHPATSKIIFAMFVGVALSITGLPTLARMMLDLNLYKTHFGMLVMSAAILDDFVGWTLVGVIFALDNLHDAGHFGGQTIATMIGITILFVITMLTIVRWLFNKAVPLIYRISPGSNAGIGFIIGMGLLGASFTQHLGIHGLFGAFIVGVVIGTSDIKDEHRESIGNFVRAFLAPIYFSCIGLSVDFIAHFDLPLVLAVIFIALVGKILGCFLVCRLQKLPTQVAIAVGVTMNNRGGMEIILATMALAEQIIDERLFVALAVMSVVTSALAGRALQAFANTLREYEGMGDEARLAPVVLPAGDAD